MTNKELTILELGQRVWIHIQTQIWGFTPWLDLTYSHYSYQGQNEIYRAVIDVE